MISNERTLLARSVMLGSVLSLFLAGTIACSSGADDLTEAGEAGVRHDPHTSSVDDGLISLSEASARNAGIEVVEVEVVTGGTASDGLQVPGRVEFPAGRVALVSPRAEGRIELLVVVEGDRVQAGQPVAYILSTTALTAQNDFVQAVRRADLLEARGDDDGARALAEAARRRLQILGMPAAEIERLEAGGEPIDLLPVLAPFQGSIVETLALPGGRVEAGDPIFRIADLSTVDVIADVPEQALSQVRVGQSTTVRLSAYPERPVIGRVERLRDELDPETRTLEAIIHVPNPARTLRPGMFATVELEVPAGNPEFGAVSSGTPVLTIPATAVVTDGATRYVFVEVSTRTYERRVVTTASLDGGERLAVLHGVVAGERVVARGAFTLKSELGKAAFGDEH